MERLAPKGRIIISAYLLLALGFLSIHLTRIEPFSAVVGRISIRGNATVGTTLAPPEVRRLTIAFNGFEIAIRRRKPVYLITDDGIRHRLPVTGWESDSDSIRVRLKYGTTLTFTSDPHGSGVVFSPSVPSTDPQARTLTLPLRSQRDFRAVPPDRGGNVWVVEGSDDSFAVTLPEGSRWNGEAGRMVVTVLGRADQKISFGDATGSIGLALREWHADGNLPGEDLYLQGIDTWREAAWTGWRNRYDPRTGLWSIGDDEIDWDDELSAALLAESLRRDQYGSQLSLVRTASGRRPNRVGYLTSPYLGEIVGAGEEIIDGLDSAANTITQQVSSETGELFAEKGMLQTLIDDGDRGAAEALLDRARTDPVDEEWESAAILSRLEILQEARRLGIDDSEDDGRRGRLIDVLSPRIMWVRDGLWLFGTEGIVNLRQSLDAARLLLVESVLTNEGLYQAAGRQMILSALNYGDTAGWLPENLLFEGDGQVIRRGRVAPEALYPIITGDAYYPRRISLSRELEAGSWLWTVAERYAFRSTPREVTLTLDFPREATHHVILHNIEPFTRVYLHDISWASDFRFERYSDGWVYDKETKTLTIKIRHRGDSETVRILYYYPDES